MAGISTTSGAHPTTNLSFTVDNTPPDTRISHTAFDDGLRNVNVTMERGDNHSVSLSLSDTHGWRYSLDGVYTLPCCVFVITVMVESCSELC